MHLIFREGVGGMISSPYGKIFIGDEQEEEGKKRRRKKEKEKGKNRGQKARKKRLVLLARKWKWKANKNNFVVKILGSCSNWAWEGLQAVLWIHFILIWIRIKKIPSSFLYFFIKNIMLQNTIFFGIFHLIIHVYKTKKFRIHFTAFKIPGSNIQPFCIV